MGWTYQHVLVNDWRKKSPTMKERKEIIDKMWNDNDGKTAVLKSSMIGSTYYAAINDNRDGNVFAVIYLTAGADRSDPYFNFGYKDMDETMGPGYCDCPKSILDLLTPTESEWANEWRKRCRENLEKKKKGNWLKELPVGGKVIWRNWNGDEYTLVKTPPMYQFKTWFWKVEGNNSYMKKSRVTVDNTRPYTEVA